MDKRTGILLTLFAFAIIGLALISTIGNSIHANTNSFGYTEDEIIGGTPNNDTEFTTTDHRITSVLYITNTSNQTLTAGTHYIAYLNNTNENNIFITTEGANGNSSTEYAITYTFDQPEYVRDQSSRTFTGLVPLFFALGILITIIIVVLRQYPDLLSK